MNGKSSTMEKLKTDGRNLLQQRRLTDAASIYLRITKLDPNDAEAWHRLSAIYGMLGNFSNAESCARKALELNPSSTSAYNNLGAALLAQNKLDLASDVFQTSLRLNPNNHEALNNIGTIHMQKGEFLEASRRYEQAILLAPDFSDAYSNLGSALLQLRRPGTAQEILKISLRINPHNLDSRFNYAKALQALGKLQQALDIFNTILTAKPDHLEAAFGVGEILHAQGNFDGAIQCYENLLCNNTNNARLLGALASVKKDIGDVETAISLYKRAATLNPEDHGIYSNYLMCLNYSDTIDPMEVAKEHLNWGESITLRYRPDYPFDNNNDHKKITIGLISNDFRTHSVSYFIEPIISHYDRNKFKLVCYANMAEHIEDDTTARVRNHIDLWRNISELSDTMAADLIHDDGIDILIDLSGHTAWNRLPVFALKPAPLQITYLGYPNTTGLGSIDYRITDTIADPLDSNEDTYSETLLRMPHSFLCYSPPVQAPQPGAPPSIKNGHITFGSFNALPKIGPSMVALWGEILEKSPGSRLIIKNASLISDSACARLRNAFADTGIDSQRLELLGPTRSIEDHLSLYRKVDIALDTFPYNGTTTSCEALWMGVPLITLSGSTHVSRVSKSILHQLNLDGLVATSPREYVNLSINIAGNREELQSLRYSLRSTFNASTLCQQKRFSREFFNTILTAWNKYKYAGVVPE